MQEECRVLNVHFIGCHNWSARDTLRGNKTFEFEIIKHDTPGEKIRPRLIVYPFLIFY